MKNKILIAAVSLLIQSASFASDGDGRYWCMGSMQLKRAGSGAGAQIRDIADRHEGFYCSLEQSAICSPPGERHRDYHHCTIQTRAGRDRYESVNSSLPTGPQRSTYDLSCYAEDFPAALTGNYGSHWLKQDANGEADSCMFAAYPSMLTCPSGYQLTTSTTTNSALSLRGWTCSKTTPPLAFAKPTTDANGNR